jgi:hypothetical protein
MEETLHQKNSWIYVENMEQKYSTEQPEHLNKMELSKGTT